MPNAVHTAMYPYYPCVLSTPICGSFAHHVFHVLTLTTFTGFVSFLTVVVHTLALVKRHS